MDDNIALLFSGGLDSFCAHRMYVQAGIKHDLIWLNCGTETNKYEAQRLDYLLYNHIPPYITVNVTDISDIETESGFVPLRNLLFAATPVMYGYRQVAIAAVKGEGSLDKSRRFFRETSELFSYILDE